MRFKKLLMVSAPIVAVLSFTGCVPQQQPQPEINNNSVVPSRPQIDPRINGGNVKSNFNSTPSSPQVSPNMNPNLVPKTAPAATPINLPKPANVKSNFNSTPSSPQVNPNMNPSVSGGTIKSRY